MNEVSLFDALREAGLERLRFSRLGGETRVLAAAPDGAWEPAHGPLASVAPRLLEVTHEVEASGHERLDLVYRHEVGLRFACAVHSTRHGAGAGGLRRHDPVTPESEVLTDVLGLARAMSYKHAFAGTKRGGSKLCVHNTDFPPFDRERWLDLLAEELALSGTITGPDTGFGRAVYLDLQERTPVVTGLRGSGTGGAASAGVLAALNATAAALGDPLKNLKVAVQGLGDLGMALAEALANLGCELVVTDRDANRMDSLLASLEPQARRRITTIAPFQILQVEADILAPNAVGGVIGTEDLMSGFGYRAVCGGANRQLRGATLTEEREIADRLHALGVLYVPDWMASAGGAIAGVMEYQLKERFDPRATKARVQRICGWQTDEVLVEARRRGKPPLEIAIETWVRALHGAR